MYCEHAQTVNWAGCECNLHSVGAVAQLHDFTVYSMYMTSMASRAVVLAAAEQPLIVERLHT